MSFSQLRKLNCYLSHSQYFFSHHNCCVYYFILKTEILKFMFFNFRTPSEWFKEYDPTNVAFNPAVMPPVKVPQRIPAHYPTLPYADVLDINYPNVNFSKDFF